MNQTFRHWLHGIRFYIAVAIGFISLEVWWWASVNFAGSNLFGIRLAEAYAWFAVGFLTVALSIGPSYKVFRKLPAKRLAFESRRLLGIGAAWFSSLHIAVAYVSLFRLTNPFILPGTYQRSFLLGGVAWLILLAMAFTSFNAAMRRMGTWWFRLHRLVYLAAALSLLHAFTIGTHAARPAALITLGVLSGGLLVLHSLAIIKQGKPVTKWQLAAVGVVAAGLVIVFNYGYNQRNQYQAITTTNPGATYRAQIY